MIEDSDSSSSDNDLASITDAVMALDKSQDAASAEAATSPCEASSDGEGQQEIEDIFDSLSDMTISSDSEPKEPEVEAVKQASVKVCSAEVHFIYIDT